MSQSAWFIPAGIALGVGVLLAPRLLGRVRDAVRVTRGLRASHRVAELPPDRLAALDARAGALGLHDVLDDRSWEDLHLADVFHEIDRCASQPGRQALWRMLRRPALDGASIDAFDATVRALQADQGTRVQVHAMLAPLAGRAAAQLEAVIHGTLPPRPALWWVFPLLTAASLALLVSLVWWPQAILWWLGTCVLTVLAQVRYRPQVREFVPAMQALPEFLSVARRIGAMQVPALGDELAALRAGSESLRGLQGATGWLRFERTGASEAFGMLHEYGNLLFALDLTTYVLTVSRLHAVRSAAQAMFEALCRVDVLCAIAEWRESLPVWSTPVFTAPRKALACDDLAHPLLEEPVRNSLTLDGASLLLTGSNMSGKTTFLRALGVNAVLAQAVGTVCARNWQAPALCVRTSIGQADSLQEGRSFYMAEIESVRRMIELASGERPALFLIDELFRGTNTPERVAAGGATLQWLDRGHDLVCVATHDIELHEVLGARFVAHHFREQVDDASLSFDYRMRPGLSSTRNAIALLALAGYPPGLVSAANAALDARTQGDVR